MSLITYRNSSLPLGTRSHTLFSTHDLTCSNGLNTRVGSVSNQLFQDQGKIFLQDKTIVEVVEERIFSPSN